MINTTINIELKITLKNTNNYIIIYQEEDIKCQKENGSIFYITNAKGSLRVDILITNKVNSDISVVYIKTGRAKYRNKQKRKNERNINGPNNANGFTFTHIEVKP